jgi:hypothetical protein
MNQDVLDRLVSVERATRVAEILFEGALPSANRIPCFAEPSCAERCTYCRRDDATFDKNWVDLVAKVRAAIQSTFTLSAGTPVETNSQSRES